MKKKKEQEADKNTPRADRKPNWKEVYATVEDIQQYLDDRVMLRFNVVTHQTEVHWLTDWGDDLSKPPEWERMNDRIENTLWKDLSKQKPVRMRDLQYVIGSDYVAEYNPFAFYLEHLQSWNGNEDHIFGLSLSVSVEGGTDEQFLFAEYLKKWLVAMVASWIDDRVVNNVMLVLIGEQGAYKTTWFAHLLPPPLREYFYTKTNSGMVSKDDLLTLSQYGLMCWEELDSMQLKELNKLKAAMTMPSINERAAYAHYHENRPHLASFCGTGNNVQFLGDPTGTRRWLPFEVEKGGTVLPIHFLRHVHKVLNKISLCTVSTHTPSTISGSMFNCRLSSRPILSEGSLLPFNISLTLALLSPSISASFDWVIPISYSLSRGSGDGSVIIF